MILPGILFVNTVKKINQMCNETLMVFPEQPFEVLPRLPGNFPSACYSPKRNNNFLSPSPCKDISCHVYGKADCRNRYI